VLLAPTRAHAAPGAPVDIKAGDRVLIMGDTLLEREGAAGALESRMARKFASVPFMVRNLSFSADLPTGVSRCSFDQAPTGTERIKNQLTLVKPTVAVLGYGMAASLEEMTYASGDPNLNPDPDRYGKVFTAAKFKADLAALMDAISASAEGKPVRFILLTPLRHEDLRSARPGLPDPAAHNALLAQYSEAIRELGKERGARVIDQGALLQGTPTNPLTDNGIHPSNAGLERWADALATELGWNPASGTASKALRTAIQRKNELFFHRWRPANHTYIFGFRKREQGRNAVEIDQFDTLLATADAAIEALKAGKPQPEIPTPPADIPADTPIEEPDFKLEDGLQIQLWAQNPLLSKPVEMNWDAKGRLWVASTPIYPQIQPGAFATDKIFILEDTKGTGKADKTTVFTENLLIPTGVEPDLTADGKNTAYVGASTDLFLLSDTDGDGKADTQRTVLSGFGTEDTHHTIHTLHWGVDGRLYFSQSIYIHSHMETPWGVVRLNSGGVVAYDPRTERVEVFSKGLVNTWGHQMLGNGQSFLTDGAGGNGISWTFPGGTFSPSEGSKGTMPSVSPGGYPKFCSLELIRSPHFPASWQGNAITCDFRAHRIVRFALNDLTKTDAARSGFLTEAQPDVLSTPDAKFRPIDVKLGPDGALYVADWTNPIINHGEVDFRDPRRDKKNGRIWRISHKDGKPVAWKPQWGRSVPQLLDALLSANEWEQEQARRVLVHTLSKGNLDELNAWQKRVGTSEAALQAAFVRNAVGGAQTALTGFNASDADTRAWEARWLGAPGGDAQAATRRLVELSSDASPRVRVEAMRALSRRPSATSAEAIANAAGKTPADDKHYAFAAQLSMREAGSPWLEALLSGQWNWKAREDELKSRLGAVDFKDASRAVQSILEKVSDADLAQGPSYLNFIGTYGGNAEADRAWSLVADKGAKRADVPAELPALVFKALQAAAERGVRPTKNADVLQSFLDSRDGTVRRAALSLAGQWHLNQLAAHLGEVALGKDAADRAAAIQGLRALGGSEAAKQAMKLLAPENGFDRNLQALSILAKASPKEAIAATESLLTAAGAPDKQSLVWRTLNTADTGLSEKVVNEIKGRLSPEALKAGLQAAQELGSRGRSLVSAFQNAKSKTPVTAASTRSVADWVKLVQGGGNALKGEQIYHSATMTCVQCHAIGGAGGKLGPDMSTLGASAPLDYVVESVLNPAAKVKEGYHGVSYTLTDGTSLVGVPFEEDSTAIRVRMPGGIESQVPKAKIKSSEIIGSLMPAGLIEALSEEDKINLFAFLGAVGKPGAFDASNNGIARIWRVTSNAAQAKSGENLAAASAAYTLTDGRLLPEHLQMTLAGDPKATEFFAVARLQVAKAGKVKLEFLGANQLWIDGEKVSEPAAALERELSAGVHTLTVALPRNSLPATLRAVSHSGVFITP
jgi:putative heme-binding domain-containing protein